VNNLLPFENNQLVSVERSDPQFQALLDGSFSKIERALPIKSMNVNSAQERVLFQIVPARMLKKPAAWAIVARALRVEKWPLVLVPPILLLSFSPKPLEVLPWPLILSAVLGAFFLFISVHLYNDYQDHMAGVDRLVSGAGSQIIQKGWVRAIDILRFSQVALTAGIVFGAVAAAQSTYHLWAVAGIALVGILAHSAPKFGLKYRGWGEWLAFVLAGPALSTGLEIIAFGMWTWRGLIFGALWGALALVPMLVKNLESIMVDSMTGVSNWVTRLGFDRAVFLIRVWIVLSMGATAFFNIKFGHILDFLLAFCIQNLVGWLMLRKLKELRSCVGSELRDLQYLGLLFFNLTAFWWTVSRLLITWSL
jgi:1,4-dihydroxy-2-naphthoate octaprenyltransferase